MFIIIITADDESLSEKLNRIYLYVEEVDSLSLSSLLLFVLITRQEKENLVNRT